MTKKEKLFIILGGFFIANALLAEFIGVKIFSLEKSLGLNLIDYTLFNIDLNLSYTAGVIIWPIVFIMTDIINEYYGKKGVRFLSLLAASIIGYSFFVIYFAIEAAPADWWVSINKDKGVPDMNIAYSSIFGQGMNIIYASLVAFVLGQLLDVLVFQKIKSITGDRFLWLRATGSTVISQAIDSFVVIFLAFYVSANWPLNQVMAVAINNYIYKFIVAIAITPLLYFVHAAIDRYLGKEEAEKMIREATMKD